MRAALCLFLVACSGSKTAPAPAPPEPAPETARVTEPVPTPARQPEPDQRSPGCAPRDVALDQVGSCAGTFASMDQGDFFYVNLEEGPTFTCGPCDGCEGLEPGTPITVHWKVQSVEIPEGSPATLNPMVERCSP